MLAPNPDAQNAPELKFYDCTVVRKRVREYAEVMPVPPEEFGISRMARSLKDCGYCFHEVLRRQSELIAQGYDERQIRAIPTYNMLTNPEQLSRDTVDEHLAAGGDQSVNEANRTVKITEHYIKLDMNKDGNVQLWRITTGGEQGEILKKDGQEEIVQEEYFPFACMTPVIMTHRFFGRSIADLVMDIQRIKTALYRAILDNAYLAVNPNTEVPESHANENTLDDLLVRKPGGIVRTKMPGGLQTQDIPFVGQQIMPLIEYVDATREWRTGVSRAGQGLDANALQNQSATAANQLFTAAQARMKLIARIFAETGIKDLFLLLHAVVRKNGGKAETVRLRNNWVQIDPRAWQQRYDMTVNVGLGTGTKAEQLLHLQTIINAQIQAVQAGLVSRQNLYNSAKQLTRLSGFHNQDEFFLDPRKPPDPNDPASQPIPPPPDPKHAEIAAKAQAEQAKIQADMAHQKMKTEADVAFQSQKMQLDAAHDKMKHDLDANLAVIKAQLEERVAVHNMQMKERELQLKAAADAHKANIDMEKAKRGPKAKASIDVKHGADEITGPLAAAIEQFGNRLTEHHKQMAEMQQKHLEATRPKGMRVVRDAKGKVSHTEPIH